MGRKCRNGKEKRPVYRCIALSVKILPHVKNKLPIRRRVSLGTRRRTLWYAYLNNWDDTHFALQPEKNLLIFATPFNYFTSVLPIMPIRNVSVTIRGNLVKIYIPSNVKHLLIRAKAKNRSHLNSFILGRRKKGKITTASHYNFFAAASLNEG